MKITSHMTSAKALGVFTVIAVLGLLSLPRAEAVTQYWDTNNATAGTGTGAQAGTWDAGTTPLWTTVLAGDVATGTWTNGNDASFSAGTNGTGVQTVTVSGNVTASGIIVKEGTLTLNGTSSPSLTIGTGGINVTSTNGTKTTLNANLGTVVLSGNQTWNAGGGSTGFAINNSITTNAGANSTFTLTITGGGTGTATASATVLSDGAGGGKMAFSYQNTGQLTMTGANTYSGGTTLSGTTVNGTSSALIIVNTNGSGSSGNVTNGAFGRGAVTIDGGLVTVRSSTAGNVALYNDIILNGNLQFTTQSGSDKSVTIAGPITITGGNRTIVANTSQAAGTPALGIISGNIGDGGNTLGLTKSGTGNLTLTGNNTYTGDTRIGNGTMAIGAASGTGTLALQNTTVDLNAADVGAIQFGTSNATTTTSATFGGLKGSRNLALTNANATPAAVALTVGGNNGNTTYSGNLTGAGGSLTKSGNGTLTLSGTNTYTGTTTVSTGTLLINGNQSSASGNVTVISGAILGGNGTIGGAATINAGATLSPGNSPGNLTFSNGLTLAGAYKWELAALSTSGPGTNFDLITVTAGDVNITGASMNLTLGVNAPSSNVFWTSNQTWTGIVNNTGGGSLIGSFAAIDNSSWSAYGAFSTANVGNDVNLVWTAVPEPATWVLAFSGLSFVLVVRRLRHRC